MNTEKIRSFREYIESLARQAGGLIEALSREQRSIEFKGTRDMVTQVDKAAEDLIVSAIRDRFPEHQILAEEGQNSGRGSSPYRWIIDPLDGTTNFVHGFPVYGVSIALEYEDEIIVGAVFDPTRNECFSAGQGLGAALNGETIQTTAIAELGHSLLATGFPYTNNDEFRENMNLWRHVYGQTQGLRRAGAAAIDMAWVACGRLDGYWEFGIKPWDIAAGTLLIKEAGGTVTNMVGGPCKLDEGQILATNGPLHTRLLNQIKASLSDTSLA